MRMAPYRISVVIPAYNEGHRLPAFMEEIARLGVGFSAAAVDFLVVDDGSARDHLERHSVAVDRAGGTLQAAGAHHRVRLVRAPLNMGKGAAIRLGWRESDPESAWLGFVDADGAIPAREVWRLIGLLDLARFDMLAGARIRMAGHHIERSLVRHLQGRVFATFAERWIPNGFYDTQCGFKLVAADRIRRRLDDLVESRWLLDVELIALLQHEGGRCIEEPIDWSDPGGSKVIPLLDPMRMLLGLHRLRRRLSGIRRPDRALP
jgi:dolichyl-phosphate beta-glucosyltransferase